MTLDQMERGLRARIAAFPPAARSELKHHLELPRQARAERIGLYWGHPATRSFAELLIDLEDDGPLRAVLYGLLINVDR